MRKDLKAVSYSNLNLLREPFSSAVSSFPFYSISFLLGSAVWSQGIITLWLLQASLKTSTTLLDMYLFKFSGKCISPMIWHYMPANLQDWWDELGGNRTWICFLQKCQYLLKQRGGRTPTGMPSVLVFESLLEDLFTAEGWLFGITDNDVQQGGLQIRSCLM